MMANHHSDALLHVCFVPKADIRKFLWKNFYRQNRGEKSGVGTTLMLESDCSILSVSRPPS